VDHLAWPLVDGALLVVQLSKIGSGVSVAVLWVAEFDQIFNGQDTYAQG
jgi:hypothetical protein